jgi:hypothetical protein
MALPQDVIDYSTAFIRTHPEMPKQIQHNVSQVAVNGVTYIMKAYEGPAGFEKANIAHRMSYL